MICTLFYHDGHYWGIGPWLYSLLRPQERFFDTYRGKGYSEGWRVLATDPQLVIHRMWQEYEREVLAELNDPEWPCRYWVDREEVLYAHC